MNCATCQIKDCATTKGLEGCNTYDEWPCALVANYPFPAAKEQMMRAVPMWKKLGTEAWTPGCQAE
ncbi:MAG: hypothetical protein HN348_25125 [Proteobacteria bacterium]|jgi:hypothetical protein|nr:hypothetical protein [Pseudomonadota bacterium]